MVNRVGAFLTLCALLSGGIIAPALDASAEHRAGIVRVASAAAPVLDVAPAHDFTNCAIVLAATVSPSLPGSGIVISRVLDASTRPRAIESRPDVPSAPFLLPPSRAPPLA